jgi:sugar-phosphatase
MRLTGRAVLFDNDGVLVDSDDSVANAWSRWARRYGLAVDDVVQSVYGRRSADTVAAFLPTDTRDAVVVEDSPGGIRAARRAGARAVVGVSPRARGSDADVLVTDLRALTWMRGELQVDPTRMLEPQR